MMMGMARMKPATVTARATDAGSGVVVAVAVERAGQDRADLAGAAEKDDFHGRSPSSPRSLAGAVLGAGSEQARDTDGDEGTEDNTCHEVRQDRWRPRDQARREQREKHRERGFDGDDGQDRFAEPTPLVRHDLAEAVERRRAIDDGTAEEEPVFGSQHEAVSHEHPAKQRGTDREGAENKEDPVTDTLTGHGSYHTPSHWPSSYKHDQMHQFSAAKAATGVAFVATLASPRKIEDFSGYTRFRAAACKKALVAK